MIVWLHELYQYYIPRNFQNFNPSYCIFFFQESVRNGIALYNIFHLYLTAVKCKCSTVQSLIQDDNLSLKNKTRLEYAIIANVWQVVLMNSSTKRAGITVALEVFWSNLFTRSLHRDRCKCSYICGCREGHNRGNHLSSRDNSQDKKACFPWGGGGGGAL